MIRTGSISRPNDSRGPADPYEGRVGVYAALVGSSGAIPLPFVPRYVSRRVRAALVRDLAASFGISLTSDARDVLSDLRGPTPTRRLALRALELLAERIAKRSMKALAPLALVRPVRAMILTYVLGRQLERYLQRRPASRGLVIEGAEARRIREAIDGSLVRTIAGLDLKPMLSLPLTDPSAGLFDRVLERAARVPDSLARSLDSAFDDLIA